MKTSVDVVVEAEDANHIIYTTKPKIVMKHIFLTLLLCVASLSFAQIKVEGVVKDSIGEPLELANVIAINQVTKSLESYAVTNDKGRFKLSLDKNTSYKLQVSYIGMKSHDQIISTKESDITKNFTLLTDNALDAVEIVYEMPVTMKGDTLIYNADSFKNGTERRLEDVLDKLPGVEINDDGEIEVEGKKVTKLMVDGKDFFDGDSKLATKNIPANAVDKIEVLKNFSEVGQLSSVTNNQDNTAINIRLKEGKKNFWFGSVTAGSGVADTDGLYLVQPKLFYYSPKYSINLIGDINNIGEIGFTRRDYFNFSGGFRSPSRSSGTSIDLGSNDLGFLTLQNNQAKAINTKFGAANFSYSPNDALDLSGFAIFSNNKNELQENNSVQYTDSDLGIPDEDTESNTIQRSDLGMLKLSAKYKPNGNNQLEYDVLGRISKETQDQNYFSSVIGDISQDENSSPFSINQSLNYYYTLDENNIFSFEAQHLIKDEDPFYNAILQDQTNYQSTADALGFDSSQTGYNFAQDKRVQSNQLDAKLDYWRILNAKSNINVTFGTILSHQQFDSEIFQYLDDGSIFEPTPVINNGISTNDTDYNFTDVYAALHYRLKTGKFTFTPGLSIHGFRSNNVQDADEYQNSFFKVLPDFDMRIQLKKSEHIGLNYTMQTQFTDVTNLARGLVLNNYNSIFSGNQTLDNALSHNINLSYFSFNLFNYTNIFANVSYSKKIDQIRSLTNFESVIRTNSPFNSSFADETASASGRFQRRFGKFQASANGSFSYSKFNQFIQTVQSTNENYTQTYRGELRTNFRDAPNFEIGYRYSISDNDQGSSRTKFFTKAPSVEFDALIFKTLTFKTDYSYTNLSDESGTINDYDFWNASLSYRKNADAKLEYEVKATNLLNTKSQAQSNTSAFSVSATEYFIQPRFVTFRLVYEL